MRRPKVLLLRAGKMGEFALPIFTRLADEGVIEVMDLQSTEIPAEQFDILFSVSWPHRITQDMCKQMNVCAVNIHTGLLPKQRGSHPLNWALVWGDTTTGVTIHKIVDSFDAGDILHQVPVHILESDTIRTLTDKCMAAYEPMLRAFLSKPFQYLAYPRKQNQAEMSYAQKRLPEDCEVNLNAPARDMYNLFRACDPDKYPAYAVVDGVKKTIKNITPTGEITYEK